MDFFKRTLSTIIKNIVLRICFIINAKNEYQSYLTNETFYIFNFNENIKLYNDKWTLISKTVIINIIYEASNYVLNYVNK